MQRYDDEEQKMRDGEILMSDLIGSEYLCISHFIIFEVFS